MNIKTKTSKKMVGIAVAGVLALNGLGTVAPSTGIFNTNTVSAATKSSTTTFAKKTLITVKNSNLYTTASNKSKVQAKLGLNVKVTSTSKTGSYYKVLYGSKTGYIYASNLKTYVAPKPAPKPTPKPTTPTKPPANPEPTGQTIPKQYFLTTDTASLYASYSKTSTILKVIPYSKKISSTYKIGDFYKITYGTATGYVHKSQLAPYVAPTPTKNPTTKSMDTDKGEAHVKGLFEQVFTTTTSDIFLGKLYGEDGAVLSMSFDILNKSNGARAISIGAHYKNLSSGEKQQFMKDSVQAVETLFGADSKYAVELQTKALKALEDKQSSIVLVDNRSFNLSYDEGFVTIIPV